MHPAEVTLDVFPSREQVASFTAYDDDGATYGYEKGLYRKQTIRATWSGEHVVVDLSEAEGTFASSVQTYLLRVHGPQISGVSWKGRKVAPGPQAAGAEPSWKAADDRFGNVVEIRLKARVAARLELTAAR